MPDFRHSARARRQSWFGVKRHVKNALSRPAVHRVLRLVAPRLSADRRGRLPAPASVSEVRGHVTGGEYVLLGPDRCEIAKELYWGSGYRPEPADAFALEVAVALTRPAHTFFDVGAYTGVFTVAVSAANSDLRSHAFEIVPAVSAALVANVARNGISDRVQVHQVGLGDPAMTMRVPGGDNGSALPSFYSADMDFADGDQVGFTSLDEFTEEVQGPVVLKVDIEGGEAAMLAHGQKFLARHRPDMLCEVLEGTDVAELEAMLVPHGLRFYRVHEDHVVPYQHLEPLNTYRDWVLTTKGPQELTALGIPVAGDR